LHWQNEAHTRRWQRRAMPRRRRVCPTPAELRRTAEERKFVGYVPDSLHVAWATGTSLTRNPRFARELEAKTGKNAVVLLLCRSGNRSALAAEVAAKAGLTQVFNVLEGFEGELDAQQQRGRQNGWRFHGLPWAQD
jgi:rhodanese-related sulfurtransferase